MLAIRPPSSRLACSASLGWKYCTNGWVSSGIAYWRPSNCPAFQTSGRKRSAVMPCLASSSSESGVSCRLGPYAGRREAWKAATSGERPPTAASDSFV